MINNTVFTGKPECKSAIIHGMAIVSMIASSYTLMEIVEDKEKLNWRNKIPVHKSSSGYKFGKSGKLYHGKDTKKKAQKQAGAIYASGYKEKRK